MHYDFDRIIDRTAIDSLKWTTHPKDVLPLWVADSDFPSPKPVDEVVRRIVELGVYGYPNGRGRIVEPAAVSWFGRRGLAIEEKDVRFCPSMSFGLAVAIRAFSAPGEKVLMQTPIYPPFMELTEANGRECSMNMLRLGAGGWEIDFEDFERRAADPACRLFLLCSPHNPTGKVLSREELSRLVEICRRHGVVILSDEVHSGFVFKGEHVVLPTLSEQAREITVLGDSPSKTFNTAGLRAAVLVTDNPGLMAKLDRALAASQPDRCCFAQAGLAAAWTQCDDYAEQVRDYVEANLRFAAQYFAERIPAIRTRMPEASYLMWLDCSRLGFATQAELTRFFLKEAKVALNPGESFGPGGRGHMRLNAACPRATLEEALRRIERACARFR